MDPGGLNYRKISTKFVKIEVKCLKFKFDIKFVKVCNYCKKLQKTQKADIFHVSFVWLFLPPGSGSELPRICGSTSMAKCYTEIYQRRAIKGSQGPK